MKKVLEIAWTIIHFIIASIFLALAIIWLISETGWFSIIALPLGFIAVILVIVVVLHIFNAIAYLVKRRTLRGYWDIDFKTSYEEAQKTNK